MQTSYEKDENNSEEEFTLIIVERGQITEQVLGQNISSKPDHSVIHGTFQEELSVIETYDPDEMDAKKRFNNHNFQAEPNLQRRYERIVGVIQALNPEPTKDDKIGQHYSQLLLQEKTTLNKTIEEVNRRYRVMFPKASKPENTNTVIDLIKKIETILQTSSAAGIHSIPTDSQCYFRLLLQEKLIAEQVKLKELVDATAQTRFQEMQFETVKNLPDRLQKIHQKIDEITVGSPNAAETMVTDVVQALLGTLKEQTENAIKAAEEQFKVLQESLENASIEGHIEKLTQTLNATNDASDQSLHYQSLVTQELAEQKKKFEEQEAAKAEAARLAQEKREAELKAAQLFEVEAQHLQAEPDLTQRLAKIEAALNVAHQIATKEAANEQSYCALLISAQSQTNLTINAARQQFQSLLETLPPEKNINERIAELQKAAQVPSKSTDSAQHTYYQSLVAQELAAQQQKLAEQARAAAEANRLAAEQLEAARRAYIANF